MYSKQKLHSNNVKYAVYSKQKTIKNETNPDHYRIPPHHFLLAQHLGMLSLLQSTHVFSLCPSIENFLEN